MIKNNFSIVVASLIFAVSTSFPLTALADDNPLSQQPNDSLDNHAAPSSNASAHNLATSTQHNQSNVDPTSSTDDDLASLADDIGNLTVETPDDPISNGAATSNDELAASIANDQASVQGQPSGNASSSLGSALQSIYQSMNPDLALILDVALAGFFGGNPIQVGAHDPNKNGFNLQQLEMSAGASIDPFFRFDTNIVFSLFGVEVEEAYVTTLGLPWNLQIRVGQFLTLFGRLNPTHPHSWHFIDQPIVNGKFFGGEGNRGLGAEVSWLAPLPWYVNIIGSVTGAAGECCARSYFGGEDLGVNGPGDLLYNLRIEQFVPINSDLGLLIGLNGQTGPNPMGHNTRTNIFGGDLFLRWRPADTTTRTAVDLTIEAMYRSRQAPHRLLKDFGTREELIWRINPEWEVGARHEYVSGLENDPLNPEWTSGRNRVALQGTYYPTHFSRIRLQGGMDRPGWLEKPIWTTMLSLEVVAGAHGAHNY